MSKLEIGPGAEIIAATEHDRVAELINKIEELTVGYNYATIAYAMAQSLAFNFTDNSDCETVMAMRVVSFCDLLRVLVCANSKITQEEAAATGTRH